MDIQNKHAFLAPATGSIEISVIRDSRPYVSIALDLGIPNFTFFTLKVPLVEDSPTSMSGVIAEAVHALLDEMSAFMISMDFAQDVIVKTYSTVLHTFKNMTGEADTSKSMDAVGKDPVVKTFEGTFKMPMELVNETYDKVVTASSGKVIKRPPYQRHLEFTYEKPSRPTVEDARRVIRNIKTRTMKTQPNPMYLMVVDMQGKPKGTVPLNGNFKNQLLQMFYKKKSSKTPEFTPTIKFDNDIEMKTTNAEGIPKSIFVGDEQYVLFAYIGTDMALYKSSKKEWVTKFADGRCVAFSDFPSIDDLKDGNYPVPAHYTNWTVLSKNAIPESSDEAEAVDEQGNEVIEEAEVESNPISDLKADDDKNEQLEEGEDESAQSKVSSRLDKLKARRPDLVENGFFDEPIDINALVQDENIIKIFGLRTAKTAKLLLKKAEGHDEKGYWVGAGGGASGILPVCTTTGRIALAWRSPNVHKGDCWGTIGGAIQKGKSPAESAKAELAEETGYTGSIRLVPAFVFQDGTFKYHNYIGLVPVEFGLNPMEGGHNSLDFIDETDALEWFTWEEIQTEIEKNPGHFHSGLTKLLEQSERQICQVCDAVSTKE